MRLTRRIMLAAKLASFEQVKAKQKVKEDILSVFNEEIAKEVAAMVVEQKIDVEKDEKKKTHKAAPVSTHAKSSDSESSGLIASHALSALSPNEKCAWIVDSGATCHNYVS